MCPVANWAVDSANPAVLLYDVASFVEKCSVYT